MKETLWDYSLFKVCFVHLLDTFKTFQDQVFGCICFPECCSESIKLDKLLSHQLPIPRYTVCDVLCAWKGCCYCCCCCCSSKDGCIDSCCQNTCCGCTRRTRLECGPVRRPVLPLNGKSNPFNSKCSLHLKVSERAIWAWWWWQLWHLKANSL